MSLLDLNNKTILVTGGAGFIGSHIVEELLKLNVKVKVLDNLSTGFRQNVSLFLEHPNYEIIEGDIRDLNTCIQVCKGVDAISHQAALGSVPRSIEFPHNTHETNGTGFLNMIQAAKEVNVRRFVYASSSSVYGDISQSPKTEGSEGKLLSPYAVSKRLNEEYAGVYSHLHGLETIGLRYFNVFGPRQNPNGAYAAAIPKFLDAMKTGGEITINGDGEQTRDFTFVKNAVHANLLALSTKNKDAFGQSFNVGCGRSLTLNEVINQLENKLKLANYPLNYQRIYGSDRDGDIRNSLAEIKKIESILNYQTQYSFEEGITMYLKNALES
jgi:UDP-N-acetylglucosamine/UDP-N-acetylgalactosamine 4-epimerase